MAIVVLVVGVVWPLWSLWWVWCGPCDCLLWLFSIHLYSQGSDYRWLSFFRRKKPKEMILPDDSNPKVAHTTHHTPQQTTFYKSHNTPQITPHNTPHIASHNITPQHHATPHHTTFFPDHLGSSKQNLA